MSYGPNFPASFRRAADYVHKILLGAKPGDLPVEQPTRYDLVVNGPRLVSLIYDLLYYRAGIARVPAMLAQIKQGSQKLLQPLLEDNYFTHSSIGMGISVRCNEYVPFNDRDRTVAATQPLLPEVRESIGVDVLGERDLALERSVVDLHLLVVAAVPRAAPLTCDQ